MIKYLVGFVVVLMFLLFQMGQARALEPFTTIVGLFSLGSSIKTLSEPDPGGRSTNKPIQIYPNGIVDFTAHDQFRLERLCSIKHMRIQIDDDSLYASRSLNGSAVNVSPSSRGHVLNFPRPNYDPKYNWSAGTSKCGYPPDYKSE